MTAHGITARQVPKRATKWKPPTVAHGHALLRQYALRAGTYSLRGTEPVEVWDAEFPPNSTGAPLDQAFYFADVDEVDEEGRASLTIWEAPSGRAFYGALPVLPDDERDGPPPAAGDRLWIWTWREIADSGDVSDHRFVRVHRRQLTDEEKQELLELAARLEADAQDDVP